MRSHKRIGTLPAGLPGIALAIVAGSTSSLHAAGAGFQGLGDLPGGSFNSFARAASADGSVVAGTGFSPSGNDAFRLVTPGAMVSLGSLGGPFDNRAWGISADGSVVVGWSVSPSGREAFRWTSGTGMIGLGTLGGATYFSEARAVTPDGSVIVGLGNVPAGTEAYRWTLADGMVGLGDLPGGSFSSAANAVSAEGSVVVGYGSTLVGVHAFIWDATNGMRDLRDVLIDDLGLDLTGWTLLTADSVSQDGQTIVGNGTNPAGFAEGWIATVPAAGIPGDLNGNGMVDINDFLDLLAAWGGCADPCPPSCPADLDGDCNVGITDFLILLANWS